MDDESAIRNGVAEILIAISGPAISEERLREARTLVTEAVRVLKIRTPMEKATA